MVWGHVPPRVFMVLGRRKPGSLQRAAPGAWPDRQPEGGCLGWLPRARVAPLSRGLSGSAPSLGPLSASENQTHSLAPGEGLNCSGCRLGDGILKPAWLLGDRTSWRTLVSEFTFSGDVSPVSPVDGDSRRTAASLGGTHPHPSPNSPPGPAPLSFLGAPHLGGATPLPPQAARPTWLQPRAILPGACSLPKVRGASAHLWMTRREARLFGLPGPAGAGAGGGCKVPWGHLRLALLPTL